jgi:uncharacterized protein YndB with AHSA1/START domain
VTTTPPGDKATVTVLVAVDPAVAFEVFTEEIDSWWKRGPAYRVAGRSPGVLTFEPGVGGRLFERFDERLVEMGRIVEWDPPRKLAFEWRGVNFEGDEKTDVTVTFDPSPSGTRVTVEHRGFASLRPGHPVRHGLDAAPFVRMIGLWWGELLTSLREHAASRGDAT